MLNDYVSDYNIFGDVDFPALFTWLPNDIQVVISTCLAFLAVLAVLGLIKRFLLK